MGRHLELKEPPSSMRAISNIIGLLLAISFSLNQTVAFSFYFPIKLAGMIFYNFLTRWTEGFRFLIVRVVINSVLGLYMIIPDFLWLMNVYSWYKIYQVLVYLNVLDCYSTRLIKLLKNLFANPEFNKLKDIHWVKFQEALVNGTVLTFPIRAVITYVFDTIDLIFERQIADSVDVEERSYYLNAHQQFNTLFDVRHLI